MHAALASVAGPLGVFGPLARVATGPDLLRLLSVPVFGWAAYRDVRTRRVPNETWLPLVALAVVALAWDVWLLRDAAGFARRLFLIRVAASLGIVAPLGYVFWRLGGFGGADAKAVMTFAVLYPAYPVFFLPFDAWPVVRATLGVFSLTILSNTVVVGILYPVALAARNAALGRFAPAMFIGRPVAVEDVPEEYGRLLETPAGFTRAGLDIDALRMYLRWRGTTLPAVRAAPGRFRDPDSLPDERHDPGDGSMAGPPVTDGGTVTDTGGRTGTADAGPTPAVERVDWWGAATFLDEIEGSAYGTSPEQLREGLAVLTEEDREVVWITPGIPFIVPMFVGLVVALTYGDLLFAVLSALGLA